MSISPPEPHGYHRGNPFWSSFSLLAELLQRRLDRLLAGKRQLEQKQIHLREMGSEPWALASVARWLLMGEAEIQWLRDHIQQVASWAPAAPQDQT